MVATVILGCSSATLDAPPPSPGPLARHAIGDGFGDAVAEPGLGPQDHWSETYGAYMTPDFKREYLTTPPDERFDRFGLRLLDFQLREELLNDHQDQLTREEKDAYRRLPNADACRRFVAARAVAHVSSPTRR